MSTTKRTDYLSWNEYFMFHAKMAAQRSKDPNTQVGACIVDLQKKIIGTGYNGLPNGCNDDDFPWERQAEDEYNTKYPYVVHGEINAILNVDAKIPPGCEMFVTMFPCNECAKAIIQCGIKRVYYNFIKNEDSVSNRTSRRMFEKAGIELIYYQPNKSIELTI